MEIWKNIIGYEDLYQVSDLGRIKSLFRYKKVLTPLISYQGYHKIFLCKNKLKFFLNIHRLVAQAFIPNTENKPYVNHKNGIKNDNRVENLEWCTQSENVRHAYDTLGHKAKRGIENYHSKQVLQFDKQMNFIKKYGSLLEAQRETGVFATAIGQICMGKHKTAGGFIWRYYI